MAFRILSEEELSLLTGRQREQYEREFDISQKRAAFVEQIDRYEGVEIKPFQPKLDFIAPPGSPDIEPYHQREYKVKLPEPSKRPEVKLLFTRMDVAPKPELPAVTVSKVKVREINGIESPAPILPVVHKPAKIDLSVKKIDQVRVEIPEPRKANLSDLGHIHMENVRVHISGAAPQPPKMARLPENLPADFRKSVTGIPFVDVPRAKVPAVHPLPEPGDLKLPDIPKAIKIPKAPESEGLRDLRIAVLPAVQKPEIPEKTDFREIKIQVHKTESFHVPEVKTVPFIQPDIRPKGLQKVKKAEVKTIDFQVPQPLQPVRVKKAEPPAVKKAAVRQIRIPGVSVDITPGEAVKIPDINGVLAGFFKENTEKEQ